jgi:hypothetical protein
MRHSNATSGGTQKILQTVKLQNEPNPGNEQLVAVTDYDFLT